MCEILSVSSSGYYSWLKRQPSARAISNIKLDIMILQVYKANKKRYGSPRITRALRAMGHVVSVKRVANRMKKMKLKAIARRKFKATTNSNHSLPIYDNVLNQDFTTSNINEKWVSDITYIPTDEGWLYLAVVIDVYSRAVIGWAMGKYINQRLVTDALSMALFKRKFPKGVIVHSDRGSQYCSYSYRNLIDDNSLIGSMSRKGNCWDNSVAESFFHTLKVELVKELSYQNRDEAKQSIFEYIEGYYNRKRIHSSIDYKTPSEVELAA